MKLKIYLFIIGSILLFFFKPNVYISECPICKKTIYAWQSYERRESSLKQHPEYAVSWRTSALYHKNCLGIYNPNITITVEEE